MDFSLTDDHMALQDAVRRFCDGEYPAHTRGNPEPVALAAQRWTGMAELGLLGLPFHTELGGSEQGTVELMLVATELGRCLGGGAWLSSVVMAGQLLAEAGTPAQCSEWLPGIAGGEKTLALAHAEPGSRYALASVSTTGCREDRGWSITGAKSLVLDGDRADAYLVAVRTAGNDADANGVTLLLVDAKAPGLTIERFATLDARNAANLFFDNVTVPAEAVVGTVGAAVPLLDKAIDRATAMLCAEAAGAIEALIDMTAEHLKTRKQFGAPLAKFQVLQHRLADMLIAAEQVKSMACAAAMAVDSADDVQRRRLVSAAKVVCGQAGRQVGQAAIQMHGAMGMTDESRVGHYAKRLLVIQQLFGDATHHLQRLADQPRS
ncbi:acyl-CoA dehydrogenase family protein [Piscinibacter sp.]|uniref:acyl-CoA dehydrogenase family protein n=1 Tax=Piscinibacter sp. TaxID=1903157 RepID=UPI002C40354A|nr:acyl-CoA dehydrogenase family protein [Albitalea sp.]HUG24445.1 acyl-CoA dehydrogenase family protein [Albitalea sp.]